MKEPKNLSPEVWNVVLLSNPSDRHPKIYLCESTEGRRTFWSSFLFKYSPCVKEDLVREPLEDTFTVGLRAPIEFFEVL